MPDVLDLFPKYVIPEPNTGCWLCTANNSQFGYGRFRIGGKQIPAHRYSYEISVGPIPAGMQIDHLCRQPCCVNPAHLEPVTSFENLHRQAVFLEKRRNFHCRNGHKRTPENTSLRANGRKICLICDCAAHRRWRARNPLVQKIAWQKLKLKPKQSTAEEAKG